MFSFVKYAKLQNSKSVANNFIIIINGNTYSVLKPLQRNKDIVLLSGDNDSSVVILHKASYKEKINRLINDGISKGAYVIEKNDNTLAGLKSVQNCIYWNFKKYEKYNEMRPTANQPTRLFATMKIYKFKDTKLLNINDLKLFLVIDQTGTHLLAIQK